MELWGSISGIVEVKLTSADAAEVLKRINTAGVMIFDLIWIDDLTLKFKISRLDLKKVRKYVSLRGDRLELCRRRGVYWRIKELLSRPVLVIGMVVLLILSIWVPTRIFFVQIEGNRTISARRILEKAEICGISFGTRRSEVRSEKMKNALLEAMPQLQWAGINTSGCTAVISVREREVYGSEENNAIVSSIISTADGVITEMTVTKGNPLCRVGQAVKAGQILVSGYTDCGLSIRAEQAQAEIFAETIRNLTVVSPSEYIKKGEATVSNEKISLLVGKKRINFVNSSGILDTTCDKMYLETYILLPGGFQLPMAFVTERWIQRKGTPEELDESVAEAVLLRFADDYLKQQMVAGQLRNRYESVTALDGAFRLRGRYVCTEMICKTRLEEKLPDYAEAD